MALPTFAFKAKVGQAFGSRSLRGAPTKPQSLTQKRTLKQILN